MFKAPLLFSRLAIVWYFVLVLPCERTEIEQRSSHIVLVFYFCHTFSLARAGPVGGVGVPPCGFSQIHQTMF